MPQGTRPVWKGQLRLSLVSIPVEMYTATKSTARTAFRQIHEPSGKPVHYQKVVDGLGPIETADIRKGFEYDKGDFVLLTDDEIDAVKLETRKTLELVQFVDEDDIPPLYFDAPYFLTPADDLAEDAFRVVRDALRKTRKVGLGQLALRGKEHLTAIRPCGKGLLLETLHYGDEIRKSDSFFSDISAKSADPELLDVAMALIDKKTTKFDAATFKDHYQSALRELIARKLKSKGRRVKAEPEAENRNPRGDNVVDLMAALKRSLEGSGSATKAATAKAKPASKSVSKSSPRSPVKPAARKKAS
jgi:DNA end-binding protein Ku